MQSGPVSPGAPFAPSPRRTSRLTVVLAVVAILLAGAALVVSLVRKPETPVTAQPTPTPTTTASRQRSKYSSTTPTGALCQAIAPLMRESRRANYEFSAALTVVRRSRRRRVPGYRAFTEDWANRMQAVLEFSRRPTAILTAHLAAIHRRQALYVELATWSEMISVYRIHGLSSTDYGGPLSVCHKLGCQLVAAPAHRLSPRRFPPGISQTEILDGLWPASGRRHRGGNGNVSAISQAGRATRLNTLRGCGTDCCMRIAVWAEAMHKMYPCTARDLLERSYHDHYRQVGRCHANLCQA